MDKISRSSYYNHCNELYEIMKNFYNTNMPKVHSDIKYFFKRIFYLDPDYSRGELLDICVSIDGS